jgi:hypothetical protein
MKQIFVNKMYMCATKVVELTTGLFFNMYLF